jgi:hypothetical protein
MPDSQCQSQATNNARQTSQFARSSAIRSKASDHQSSPSIRRYGNLGRRKKSCESELIVAPFPRVEEWSRPQVGALHCTITVAREPIFTCTCPYQELYLHCNCTIRPHQDLQEPSISQLISPAPTRNGPTRSDTTQQDTKRDERPWPSPRSTTHPAYIQYSHPLYHTIHRTTMSSVLSVPTTHTTHTTHTHCHRWDRTR